MLFLVDQNFLCLSRYFLARAVQILGQLFIVAPDRLIYWWVNSFSLVLLKTNTDLVKIVQDSTFNVFFLFLFFFKHIPDDDVIGQRTKNSILSFCDIFCNQLIFAHLFCNPFDWSTDHTLDCASCKLKERRKER